MTLVVQRIQDERTFFGGNSQTLVKDTNVVTQTRSMPQQLTLAVLEGLEFLSLSRTHDMIGVNESQVVV
jgi:hypothetical protein